MQARLRPVIWTVALLAIGAALYGLVRLQREDLVDFAVYRTAAERIVQAEPLYRESDGHYQYKYLPAFAFVVVPFLALPRELANIAWMALNVFLLVTFVRQSIRWMPGRRLTERALIWLAVLLLGKFVVKELLFGQTNLLLGVTLMGAMAAADARRPALAGVLAGLAVFIKPYAIIALPWLLVTAGIPSSVAAALIITAGLLLPMVTYGWSGNLQQLIGWFQTVTSTTAPNLLNAENISIATMWAKWIGPGPAATALAWMTTAASLGMPAWLVWMRARVARPAYAEFGALMLLVPLISPQGWDYVLILGAPAILCVADRFTALTLPWRAMAALGFFLTSLTIYDLMGRTWYLLAMRVSAITIGALLVTLVLVHARRRALA